MLTFIIRVAQVLKCLNESSLSMGMPTRRPSLPRSAPAPGRGRRGFSPRRRTTERWPEFFVKHLGEPALEIVELRAVGLAKAEESPVFVRMTGSGRPRLHLAGYGSGGGNKGTLLLPLRSVRHGRRLRK